MSLVYIIKVKSKEDLIDGQYGMGAKLIDKHPHWCGNYRAVYRSDTGIDFVERDKNFICYDYLYDERLTIKEALEICPEVLI